MRSGVPRGSDEPTDLATGPTVVADPNATGSVRPLAPTSSEAPATDPGSGEAPSHAHLDLPLVDPAAYAIEGEHARGGIGRILRAFDRRLGRTVALKEIVEGDEQSLTRFIREARLTARLEHPSIVPVHEAGRWPDGTPFYAMKMISGRPFSEVIRSRHSLDDRLQLLPNLVAIADAIAYAHSRGVIHRDLKPGNVLIGSYGETVVVDWGLAKDLRADPAEDTGAGNPRALPIADDGNTVVGTVLGTPAFMPPEQARGEIVDERADVYALGAIAYATLTGRAPYGPGTLDRVLRAVLDGPPPTVGELQPAAPRELLSIVERAMARDPRARYASAAELAEELRRFQAGRLVGAHHYSRAELLARWLRRNRLPVGIASVALILLALASGIAVRKVVRERDRADRERAVAVEERGLAERLRASEAARVDELIVAQARASADHDPAGALAWIKRLRASSTLWPAAWRIVAAAWSRGISERVLRGSEGAITDLAFSPPGSLALGGPRLASSGGEGRVRLWPLADPGGAGPPASSVLQLPGSPAAPAATVRRIAFAPDGTALLALADDTAVWRFALPGGEVRPLGGHTGKVVDLVVPPRARPAFALTASLDGTVRRWQLPDGAAQGVLRAGGPVRRVVVAADGAIAASRDDAGIRVWDLRSNVGRPLASEARGAGGLAISSDGRFVAATAGERVLVWDVPTGRLLARLGPIGLEAVVAFAPPSGRAGPRLAAVCEDGRGYRWDLPSTSPVELAHHGEASRDVVFSDDGEWSAAARGLTTRLWVASTGELRKLRGHEQDVTRVLFSPDGSRLATAGLDGSVRLYLLRPPPPPADPDPAWLDRATDVIIGPDDRPISP